MNKGENNAIGRLGSQYHQEPRYEGGMRSMSEASGEAESVTPEYQAEGEGILLRYGSTLAVLGASLIGTIVICLIISRMWDEDKIRIHILGFLINFFRLVARKSGGLALEFEKSYYEYVDALH